MLEWAESGMRLMPATSESERIERLRQLLQQLVRNMRAGASSADDASARELLETATEVIEGLIRSFYLYEERHEGAMAAP
jgi:hypothetical protein